MIRKLYIDSATKVDRQLMYNISASDSFSKYFCRMLFNINSRQRNSGEGREKLAGCLGSSI